MIEYALLVGFIALIAVGAVTTLGTKINQKYTDIRTKLYPKHTTESVAAFKTANPSAAADPPLEQAFQIVRSRPQISFANSGNTPWIT